MNKQEFSEFVKNTRLHTGHTKIVFAHLIGCSRTTLWRWESGITMPRKDAVEYWLLTIQSVVPDGL